MNVALTLVTFIIGCASCVSHTFITRKTIVILMPLCNKNRNETVIPVTFNGAFHNCKIVIYVITRKGTYKYVNILKVSDFAFLGRYISAN